MLHDHNSRCYRARSGQPKQALLCWSPCRYDLTWGTQVFDGPHMRVIDAGGPYGVDLAAFFTTHVALPSLPDHYFKQARVRGACVRAPFTLLTRLNGHTEMVAEVPAGAFVVQNPAGELYAMSEAEFHARYEADDDI